MKRPGWSQNPFWADEIDVSDDETPAGSEPVAPSPTPQPPAKKVAQEKKKDGSASKKRTASSGAGSLSRKKKLPAAVSTDLLTTSHFFGSDTDDVELPLAQPSITQEIGESSKVKPARAATLRSFFSQRGTSGYTTQRDLTRGGEYYVELRVYNSREAECQPSEERWKRALVTLKLCTDTQTPVWRALSTLVEAGKNEFKAIQPIMYPIKLQ